MAQASPVHGIRSVTKRCSSGQRLINRLRYQGPEHRIPQESSYPSEDRVKRVLRQRRPYNQKPLVLAEPQNLIGARDWENGVTSARQESDRDTTTLRAPVSLGRENVS